MPPKQLPDVSFKALQSELRRRESLTRRRLAGMLRARDRLTRKLAFMDEQIRLLERELGVKGSRRPGDRVRNTGSLADAVAGVLGKRPMTIAAVMETVNKSGYVSSSPNFRTMVTQTLIKDHRVKRAGRGLYVAK
ncbi:MAG: hypothetical protein K1X67_17110 [Fimbriimonadaceae bacterium]|nr:hypothetical protein [Fimbriimonadaceae bacterium]